MQKRFAIAALALIVLFSISPAEAQKEAIKVGFMSSLTGPLSPNGKDMLNSFELFLEEQGGKLAGREVKRITEDDAGNPATGLTKLRGMVEGQGIQLLVGPLSAAVGYAIRDYIDSNKLPVFFRSYRVRTLPSASAALTSFAPAGPALSRLIPSANGFMTTSSIAGLRSSAMTLPSAGRWPQDFTAPLKSRVVRSCKNSGRLSLPPTLVLIFLNSSAT